MIADLGLQSENGYKKLVKMNKYSCFELTKDFQIYYNIKVKKCSLCDGVLTEGFLFRGLRLD